ncbi:heterokaryon incompatibility protein-domain-containing protein, partial [Clohesyomyces aquaticus]
NQFFQLFPAFSSILLTLTPRQTIPLAATRNWFERPYHRDDIWPDCPGITYSAELECQLCATLIEEIRKKWKLEDPSVDGNTTLRIGPSACFWVGEGKVKVLEIEVARGVQLRGFSLEWALSSLSGAFEIATGHNIEAIAAIVDRKSEECARLLGSWVGDCVRNHDQCTRQSFSVLPTRVIDVGSSDVAGPHLMITNGETADYVALSHCWGPLVPGSRLLRTTTSNIEAMRAGIHPESMPRNYQDAVTVTLMLGIHYLWIDSLCIIQDSKDDWDSEGKKMNVIHHSAYITIVAASAKNCDAGSNWNSRGWTMQERFLSKRIIYFSDIHISFECQYQRVSEWNAFGPLNQATLLKGILDAAYLRQLYEWWYKVVEEYAHRKLTYASDKLPALSGLADKMLSLTALFTSDRYLCGIWQEDLARGLLWIYDKAGIHTCCPARGPSWSWAKCNSQTYWYPPEVIIIGGHQKTAVVRAKFEVAGIHLELAGSNPYGEVKEARLNLFGHILPATVQQDTDTESGWCFVLGKARLLKTALPRGI